MPKSQSQVGRGLLSDLKKAASKAHSFVKKNKVISKLGKAYGSTDLPFSAQAKQVGRVAGQLGYGKRRRRRRVLK